MLSTINRIPPTSPVAAYIANIAVIDSLDQVSDLRLPAKIDFILSALCERGSLTVAYDTVTRRLAEGSLMILKPGHVLRSYEATDDFKGHFIVVSTKLFGDTEMTFSKLFPWFLKFRDNPVISLTPEEVDSQTELRKILRRQAYSAGHDYSDMVVKSIVEAMFYETLGLFSSHHASVELPAGAGRKNTLFYEFLKLVEENCAANRSVAFYADKLCVSPKHLSATIKTTSGRTAGEWIDSYVITEATQLLKNTGLTIQEISMRLNFPNQSFFGKYFHRLTGVSPRGYRMNPDIIA